MWRVSLSERRPCEWIDTGGSGPWPAASERFGGGKRTRTADPLLAKQVLFQLSYTPTVWTVSLAQWTLTTDPAGQFDGSLDRCWCRGVAEPGAAAKALASNQQLRMAIQRRARMPHSREAFGFERDLGLETRDKTRGASLAPLVSPVILDNWAVASRNKRKQNKY